MQSGIAGQPECVPGQRPGHQPAAGVVEGTDLDHPQPGTGQSDEQGAGRQDQEGDAARPAAQRPGKVGPATPLGVGGQARVDGG